MKISYNWLKQYVDLKGVSPESLADALTNSGLEIEEVMPLASATNLVIGEVLSCEPHPNSDHLNVTIVEYGEGPVQIVCGAPNCRANIKVIVAKVGAILPEITIAKATVRSIESNGMLCSLKELGVNEKFLSAEQLEGIEILSDDAPVGTTDVLAYLGYDDVVLDASQTPNRADCMAMWSVAKEVAAVLRRTCKLPESAKHTEEKASLKLATKTANCPYILGKIINHVNVKASPKWMVDHLHAAGIKSINNVVDISNYVMLETGQPLHFYDLAKVPHREITVVDDVELTFTALDGNEYDIIEKDLVITTNGLPTGLAGIMGGDDSKIDETTQGILIEAAHFNHVALRNTAKRVGLMTEAASRFIKGLEPLAQAKAMERCVDLLVTYADASHIELSVEAGNKDYQPTVVVETLEHCNRLLGTNYSMDQVIDVLKALDFNPIVNQNQFTCTIPSYRTDIKIAEDIDEEIIRLIGYDSLPITLPTMEATSGRLTHRQASRRMTRNILNGVGLTEVVTYTLVKENYINAACMPFGEVVALAQPMSEDRKYVRNSLMHSMLECVAYNQARRAKDVNLFEISNVYQKGLVQERIGFALTGALQESRLHKITINSDFYTLKGIIMEWLDRLGFQKTRISIEKNTEDVKNFHPHRSAIIKLQNEIIGIIGEIHPNLQKTYGTDQVVYAELVLDAIMEGKATKVKFLPLDRYPAVKRDIALIVKDETEASLIIKTITSTSKLVRHVEIFDIYKGDHVEVGYKSIALALIYQATDRTLVEEEINTTHQSILNQLEAKCGAKLRG